METVCLGYQEERGVYAVGSRSHTTILDARSLQPIQNKNIASPFPTCGIRSVSFRGDLLTIGTGTGSILFYDLRASKYLTYRDSAREVVFKTNIGWVVIWLPTKNRINLELPGIHFQFRHRTIRRKRPSDTLRPSTHIVMTRVGQDFLQQEGHWLLNEKAITPPYGPKEIVATSPIS